METMIEIYNDLYSTVVYSTTNQVITAMLDTYGPLRKRDMFNSFSDLTKVVVSEAFAANACRRMIENSGFYWHDGSLFGLTDLGKSYAYPVSCYQIMLQGAREIPVESSEVFGERPHGTRRRADILTVLANSEAGLRLTELAEALTDKPNNIHGAVLALELAELLSRDDKYRYTLTPGGTIVYEKVVFPIYDAVINQSGRLEEWKEIDWEAYAYDAYNF